MGSNTGQAVVTNVQHMRCAKVNSSQQVRSKCTLAMFQLTLKRRELKLFIVFLFRMFLCRVLCQKRFKNIKAVYIR